MAFKKVAFKLAWHLLVFKYKHQYEEKEANFSASAKTSP